MPRRHKSDSGIIEGAEDEGWKAKVDPVEWVIVALIAMCVFGALVVDAKAATPRSLWIAWKPVAKCESGLRWHLDGMFDGGLQFHPGTWNLAKRGVPSARKYAFAYQAPPLTQVIVADHWRKRIGGNPHTTAGWPLCGRYYGRSSRRALAKTIGRGRIWHPA